MSRPLPLRHRTGAFALIAVLVLISVHLYTSVLGGSVGSRPHQVTVQMKQTGGLFAGSNVTYRGVKIGRVERIDQVADGVEARLSIEPSTDVPASAAAVVRTLSPAGEQFLDLQPSTQKGPFLGDGSTITRARTSSPTTVAETVRSVDRLMSDIDDDDLRTTLRELRTTFEDPDDLATVITSASSIVESLDRMWPQTERLLTNGRTVLRTGVEVGDDLRTFTTSAKSLTAWLKDYDPRLEQHVDALPSQVDELRSFTALVARDLPPVLAQMIRFTDIVTPRDAAFREFLRVFPLGFNRFSEAVKDGRLQTSMLISNGDVCSYGAGSPLPTDPERSPLVDGRGCPASFDGQQRGSVNAPLPEPR
ncbi:hypothetical protein ASD11_09145 [Aeromicrobium sp. Root495]|uniref:MCE family protein n=1 Tax=Aeromicrobium sp. Root495 TaxID=1736550 RepID=UPI0006FCD1CF|nr:MlaD family protein [Aeromicrobium sp. Root495]KQY59698.1 hypothetical protein ASD11_09145 [Aeromicrobium sp. Root495]